MKGQAALIVTTAHRGVFFGYGVLKNGEKSIRLERARMCIYWAPELKGVVGLASTGPNKNCRVGPAAPAITVNDVTAVMEVSDAAVKAWEDQPWN